MERIDADEVKAGFLRRHRIKLTVAALAAVGVFLLVAYGPKGSSGPALAPAPKVVSITLPPPPPPPPPPPKPREPRPETPQDQTEQMIAQEPVAESEPQPSADSASDAPLGTGVTGDGPADGFGLGTKSGGGGLFGGGPRTGGSGSRWGWYASQVQSSVQSALGAHPKTRSLALDTRVRIWLSSDGAIERVELPRSVSEAERAALSEALVGVKLRQAAPADMPMPVVMRVNLRRPS